MWETANKPKTIELEVLEYISGQEIGVHINTVEGHFNGRTEALEGTINIPTIIEELEGNGYIHKTLYEPTPSAPEKFEWCLITPEGEDRIAELKKGQPNRIPTKKV